MRGKVKWFNAEKGYGYLYGEDGKEYYCAVRDVQGGDLPRTGNRVEFEVVVGKKGTRATKVRITDKSIEQDPDDQRETCAHCGKKMVPRVAMYKGAPRRSYCPYCGGMHKKFMPCFIATAVYGDPWAPEVCALRRFRDETLETHALGRQFVRMYYRVSPPIADWLAGHPSVARLVRAILDPLARCYLGDSHEK